MLLCPWTLMNKLMRAEIVTMGCFSRVKVAGAELQKLYNITKQNSLLQLRKELSCQKS